MNTAITMDKIVVSYKGKKVMEYAFSPIVLTRLISVLLVTLRPSMDVDPEVTKVLREDFRNKLLLQPAYRFRSKKRVMEIMEDLL